MNGMITTNEAYDLNEVLPEAEGVYHRQGRGKGDLQGKICGSAHHGAGTERTSLRCSAF